MSSEITVKASNIQTAASIITPVPKSTTVQRGLLVMTVVCAALS